MAQYERFLSYLFEYEQDIKGENRGFAKIEVRGETKRIQITIKGRTPVELLHVCGFYREKDRCICVPLGRMMVNGGSGQFQYVTTGMWLRGSRVTFEQLAGLVISNPQETGRAYVTVWDDEPFGLSMFEQEEEQAADETEHVPDALQADEAAPGTIFVIRRKEMEDEAPEEEITGQSDEVNPGREAAEGTKRDASDTEQDTSGKAAELPKEEYHDESDEPKQEGTGQDEEPDRYLSGADEAQETELLKAEECGCQSPVYQTAEDSAEPYESDDWRAEGADVFWAALCRRFRKIEALPGDGLSCLRAVPADIGRLPRANWIFGNNGFLMYSYVKYRYIVFARVEREIFELWVPGTYERNEEILAEMFGFERFRSMKASKAEQGDFGYWCVPLNVPLQRQKARTGVGMQ